MISLLLLLLLMEEIIIEEGNAVVMYYRKGRNMGKNWGLRKLGRASLACWVSPGGCTVYIHICMIGGGRYYR